MIQDKEEKQMEERKAECLETDPSGKPSDGVSEEKPETQQESEETLPDESEQVPVASSGLQKDEPVIETSEDVGKSASEEAPAEKKVRTGRIKADEAPELPEEESAEKRWYVIHAHSGHENKVGQSLENRVKLEHLEHLFSQVIVPSESVVEVKGGKKRVTNRKIFPGYVMVEMKLTYKTWYLVRTTPGVTGFIGSGKKPTPLEPEEIEAIFEQMRGEQKKPKPKDEFEKGMEVKIIEGPFTSFMGSVDEVNSERGKLKVMVEIFERLTSVELEFWQVEKT